MRFQVANSLDPIVQTGLPLGYDPGWAMEYYSRLTLHFFIIDE
jgi:hypothetical protein